MALRAYEISGERVGDVLAEVEAHVRETGEDPVEAFGTPRTYAAQVATQLDRRTGKPSTTTTRSRLYAIAAVAALAVALVSQFAAGLLFDDVTPLYELPRWGAIGLGAILLAGAAGRLIRMIRRGRVVYPTVDGPTP